MNNPFANRIIILNGPPHSGKDVLGEYWQTVYPQVTVRQFKEYLLRCATSITKLKLSKDKYERVKDLPLIEWMTFAETANLPISIYPHISYRTLLQEISERFLKPVLGINCMGEYQVDCITSEQLSGGIVFTDGGFVEEVIPLAIAFPNVTVVRLARDKCTYVGDTRRYLYSKDFHTFPSIVLPKLYHNNSTLEALSNEIISDLPN